jgi:hypothetical protein
MYSFDILSNFFLNSHSHIQAHIFDVCTLIYTTRSQKKADFRLCYNKEQSEKQNKKVRLCSLSWGIIRRSI